jgi:PilZ domain
MLHSRIVPDPREAIENEAGERRHGERYVTVLKVGRAIINGHDQLCLVRNMSQKGAKLDVRHDVCVNERVKIELRSDKVVSGTVRWTGDHIAGVEFDEPIDLAELLKPRAPRSVLRKLPRAPRFLCEGSAVLEHDNNVTHGKVTNISLHGVCIETTMTTHIEEQMVVRVNGLPPRASTVRWIAPNMIGLHFDLPMGYSELARWLDDHGDHEPEHDPALNV